MNPILKIKYDELKSSQEYECWYLVKQPTAFDKICYLVKFLEEYKHTEKTMNISSFISMKISNLKVQNPNLDISDNYRALRVAAFFGLIKMTSSKYEEAIITETFEEITARCNGAYENITTYSDIVQRQIEKMFISSEIDEEYDGVRKKFKLFPVLLLYKVLLEIGNTSGKYKISINEYRYLVATTTSYKDYLNTLLLIKTYRQDDFNTQFEEFRGKFDNRFIQALKQLETLEIDANSISLKDDSINSIRGKIFEFESNLDRLTEENYINFLGSSKGLSALYPSNSQSYKEIEQNQNAELMNSKMPRNRILFGAPGTGKSYTLNQEKDLLLADGGEFERVTFHPDYSYAHFVGTYKPVPTSNDNLIQILEDIKTAEDLTIEKFNILCEKVSGENDNGRRTLLLLLGLKFPDLESKKHFISIARLNKDTNSDPNSQINYAIKASSYINKNLTDNGITYEYVPGPFMRVLVKALKSCKSEYPKPHLLMIEEINRANVAAVFGDIFQLLDRDETEKSEYSIQATEDMKKYLAKELGGLSSDYSEIRIPNNMFIWATMNSADQGVFPMDTAFKRRWEFTYLGIDDSEDGISDKKVELGKGEHKRLVNWNKLRKHINAELLTYKVNEDKLLGPYFISKKMLGNEELMDSDTFISVFKNKVIMYLFDDAAKQKRLTLFNGCEDNSKNQYSKICKEFDEKGVNIFCESISSHFVPQQDEKGDE